MKLLHKYGYSLIEILVILAIFAMLGIVLAQVLFSTLRETRKTDATSKVRSNLDYAFGVIERQVHNAKEVTSCPAGVINFKDQLGNLTSFSCLNIGVDGYIASGSARLTSNDVSVTSCNLTCDLGTGNILSSVTISLTAKSKNSEEKDSGTVDVTTKVFLRNY